LGPWKSSEEIRTLLAIEPGSGEPEELEANMASISSKKIKQGATLRADLKILAMYFSELPMWLCMIWGILIEKNGI
jgi:hypothetical protein